MAIGGPLIINSLEPESDPMFGEGIGANSWNGHFNSKFGAYWNYWKGVLERNK